jgi:hypothetical protein
VRVLIRAGIRFDEFAELARGVFVETAIRDGLDNVSIPTRARVSVVTGVSKQQVDYYIDNKGAIPAAKPTLASIMVEVLQKWHTDPQYVGPYGIPLELEFEVDSAGRCFRTLVSLVNETVSPGIVLEELLRVGSVTYSGEQHFRAVSRYFMMPEPMSLSRLSISAIRLRDWRRHWNSTWIQRIPTSDLSVLFSLTGDYLRMSCQNSRAMPVSAQLNSCSILIIG